MLSKIYSSGIAGIDGFRVTVECSSWNRLPRFELVGLPDAAVKEAKTRVQSACENSGIKFPSLDIMVNLAPANIRKEGSAFDLAIALSVLVSAAVLPPDGNYSNKCFIGELSLSGEVRPALGVLSMAISAKENGTEEIFVPEANAAEASVVQGITVYPVKSLKQLVLHLLGKEKIESVPTGAMLPEECDISGAPDFSEVRGQYAAKRALEIAVAGGHNVLMIGPPGAGKSMLAKRLPSIMPRLSLTEAIETTKIHSVSGVPFDRLVTERPFRSPHHTVSLAGFTGGGANPRPGEISLANSGVLFLDELPEFPKSVTESLRQPLEDRKITITRASATVTYPASFMLVTAMNPCKCGYFGDPSHTCVCSPAARKSYLDKISGPLLDRIDIEIELPAVTYDEISGKTEKGEPSSKIRERIARAIEFRKARMIAKGDDPELQNSALTGEVFHRHCTPSEDGEELLRAVFDRLGLSARAHDRILRVARTIADLDGSERICYEHITEAINYRTLDRKYWNR